MNFIFTACNSMNNYRINVFRLNCCYSRIESKMLFMTLKHGESVECTKNYDPVASKKLISVSVFVSISTNYHRIQKMNPLPLNDVPEFDQMLIFYINIFSKSSSYIIHIQTIHNLWHIRRWQRRLEPWIGAKREVRNNKNHMLNTWNLE